MVVDEKTYLLHNTGRLHHTIRNKVSKENRDKKKRKKSISMQYSIEQKQHIKSVSYNLQD